jgi:hypothetical protein
LLDGGESIVKIRLKIPLPPSPFFLILALGEINEKGFFALSGNSRNAARISIPAEPIPKPG